VALAIADAALNSFSSFLVGVLAARRLEPAVLGAYALAFSAFILATQVPLQLLFTPAESAVVRAGVEDRLAFLPRTLTLGAWPIIVPALGIPLWQLAVGVPLPDHAALALSLTAIAAALLAPAQDHVRRMLHLAERSSIAVVLSAVQCTVVALLAVLAPELPLPSWWIPLGALAAGNLASLGVALAIVPRRPGASFDAEIDELLRHRSLFTVGNWLVVGGLTQTGAGFLVAALVSRLAGTDVLGNAEAARVVGQPPFVLLTGLSAILGPRAVRAAQQLREDAAIHVRRRFAVLVLAAGIPYLLLVGMPVMWNPAFRLVPAAYTIPGLVAMTVAANLMNALVLPRQFELVGAQRTGRLARAEGLANATRVAAGAAAAPWLGSFALPASFLALGLSRWVGYLAALRGHYKPRDVTPTSASIPTDTAEPRGS